MEDYERYRVRRNAIVAFLSVVATTIAATDETGRGKVSSKQFLETIDQALDIRLKHSDGAELAEPVQLLRDILGSMVSRAKVSLEMERSVDKILEEIDADLDW